MTNCYWIEEQGAFEVCAVTELPPLTTGWVQFDSLPDPIVGRSHYTVWPGASIAPAMVRPAYGNGLIVIGAHYSYGVQPDPYITPGTHETTGVFVSDDDGFTYSGLIEKFTWLPGTAPAGYDGSDFWSFAFAHYGTDIYFDGSHFYVISQTMDDQPFAGGYTPRLHTSKSADGVIWTNQKAPAAGYELSQAEAYQGDLWFYGNNFPASSFAPFDTLTWVVGHSNNDGATWTITPLNYEYGWNGDPWPNFDDISANQNGLHIAAQVSDYPSYGVFYFRPTGAASWAAPMPMIFDFANPDILGGWAYSEVGPSLVASRVNPLNIYACHETYGITNEYIAFRRSLDGGLTWGNISAAVELAGSEEFHFSLTQNGARMVELDDGRLVIVFVYRNFDPYVIHTAYVVSTDYGASWGARVVFSSGEWVADSGAGGRTARLHVCVRAGVDVIVTQSRRVDFAKAYIIRP